MKCRDVEYLLVELADGTLTSEEKARVEEHLAHCEACAMDAAMLKDTFAALRADVPEPPPNHYFSTLLPKIRTRLETREERWGLWLPAWFARAAAPFAVTALATLVFVLFRVFEPGEEFSPLKNIVEQTPSDEMASIVVTTNEPFSGEFGLPSSEKILEAIPNANSVAESMKADLLAEDVPAPQVEPGTMTVESTLEDMDDDTVTQVLDRLNSNTAL